MSNKVRLTNLSQFTSKKVEKKQRSQRNRGKNKLKNEAATNNAVVEQKNGEVSTDPSNRSNPPLKTSVKTVDTEDNVEKQGKSFELNLSKMTMSQQKYTFYKHCIVPQVSVDPANDVPRYACILCKQYLESLIVVEKHMLDPRHLDIIKEQHDVVTITHMPEPTCDQVESLTRLIEHTYETQGISKEDRANRQEIATYLNELISETLPTCSIRLYGSSSTCMGLKTSDVNLDLVVPQDLVGSKIMTQVNDLIALDDRFESIVCNLTADLPKVNFLDKVHQLTCVFCVNNHNAYETGQLLAHYESIDTRVAPLAVMFRCWAAKCNIDQVDLGAWPPYAFSLLLVYFLQQILPPVLPVLHDLIDEPNLDRNPSLYIHPSELQGKWQCMNQMPLGWLWIKLFKFYVQDFPMTDRVVCIQQFFPLKRYTKNWVGRKLAIEDPFLCKRNVSRTVVHMQTFEFILHCLQNAHKFYSMPQFESGPIFGCIHHSPDPEMYGFREEHVFRTMNEPFLDIHRLILKQSGEESSNNLAVTPMLATLMFQRCNVKKFTYDKADQKTFWVNETIPVVCCSCKNLGHMKEKCPIEVLPPIKPLPLMTVEFQSLLDQLCLETYNLWSPSEDENQERQVVVTEIKEYLTRFYPTAELQLFGSSCNGFGLKKCDLDICLTFKGDDLGREMERFLSPAHCQLFHLSITNDIAARPLTDNSSFKCGKESVFAAIIEQLMMKLRRNKRFNGLIAITTAKVPILKFLHVSSRLTGDISVYNTLALRNTKLLRTYADFDPRVQMLGFLVKKLAKICEICDASRGSLSSYTYILMVIYFLQRCDPPVVPILQQLHRPGVIPKEMLVEGCNTYFFEDIDEIKDVWDGFDKNTCTVGLLLLQFMRFYTEEFDFKQTVVSIRQSEPLLRVDKSWNSKPIAVEDPFELSHNLGSGISKGMFVYIIQALQNGRTHFGTPAEVNQPLQTYFLSKNRFVKGIPPNDRGCRICKKIGHQMKECPTKRQQGNELENEVNWNKDRRQQQGPHGGNDGNWNHLHGNDYNQRRQNKGHWTSQPNHVARHWGTGEGNRQRQDNTTYRGKGDNNCGGRVMKDGNWNGEGRHENYGNQRRQENNGNQRRQENNGNQRRQENDVFQRRQENDGKQWRQENNGNQWRQSNRVSPPIIPPLLCEPDENNRLTGLVPSPQPLPANFVTSSRTFVPTKPKNRDVTYNNQHKPFQPAFGTASSPPPRSQTPKMIYTSAPSYSTQPTILFSNSSQGLPGPTKPIDLAAHEMKALPQTYMNSPSGNVLPETDQYMSRLLAASPLPMPLEFFGNQRNRGSQPDSKNAPNHRPN